MINQKYFNIILYQNNILMSEEEDFGFDTGLSSLGWVWDFFTLDAFLFFCFVVGVVRTFNYLSILLGSYFRKRKDLKKRYGGGWAVVTGGSEGIGEAISIELAKEGFDIILVSRNVQKLLRAKNRIEQANSSVQVEFYPIDLAKLTTEEQYRQAFKDILQKDVSILVNNVGYLNTNKFQYLQFEQLRKEAKLNLLPISVLTRLFLDKFQERQMSAIINLSSLASIVTCGGSSHYHATKTFDDFLSRTIRSYNKSKIDILTVRPGRVTTPMLKNTSSWTHCPAEQTAKQVLNSLGNTDICYGPFIHRAQATAIKMVNPSIVTHVATVQGAKMRIQLQKMQ